MNSVFEKFPQTVEHAVDNLISGMSFRDKTKIANMSEAKLIEFHRGYGSYIRTEFRLPGNGPLMESCRSYSELNKISELQASFIILKALQDKLLRSRVLKRVK